MDTPALSVEYRRLLEEMTRALNEGCMPDNVALAGLKQAQRSLEHTRNSPPVTRNSPPVTGKRKQRGGDQFK
ncbi:unnamed protein product [Calypogeia fissa]